LPASEKWVAGFSEVARRLFRSDLPASQSGLPVHKWKKAFKKCVNHFPNWQTTSEKPVCDLSATRKDGTEEGKIATPLSNLYSSLLSHGRISWRVHVVFAINPRFLLSDLLACDLSHPNKVKGLLADWLSVYI
jgi:hypothetical protein